MTGTIVKTTVFMGSPVVYIKWPGSTVLMVRSVGKVGTQIDFPEQDIIASAPTVEDLDDLTPEWGDE